MNKEKTVYRNRILSGLLGISLSLPLLLTGCGDPTLDLNGGTEAGKESLMNVIKSYDNADKIAFLSWYRGTDAQNKVINGRKASEIIRIVREEWKEDYVKRNLNGNSIKLGLYDITQKSLSEQCGEGREKPVNNVEKERLERIRKEEELFTNLEFACAANPDKGNSLLITIKNGNSIPLSAFSVFIGSYFGAETEIPGGVAPGETATLEVKANAVGKLAEGYECSLNTLYFYNPADDSKFGMNVYHEYHDNYNLQDLADYKEFYKERSEYYYELSGKNETCKIIENKARQLTDSAVSSIKNLTGITLEENQQ